jgi:hypothetical protein
MATIDFMVSSQWGGHNDRRCEARFPNSRPAQFSMQNALLSAPGTDYASSFVQIHAAKASLFRALTLNRRRSTFGCHQACWSRMTVRGDRVKAVDAGNKYCSNFDVKLQNMPSIKPYSFLFRRIMCRHFAMR